MSEHKPRKIVRSAEYMKKLNKELILEAALRKIKETMDEHREGPLNAAKANDVSYLEDMIRNREPLNEKEAEFVADLIKNAYRQGLGKKRKNRQKIACAMYWLKKEMDTEPAVQELVVSLQLCRRTIFRFILAAESCDECQSIIRFYDEVREKDDEKSLNEMRCVALKSVNLSHII